MLLAVLAGGLYFRSRQSSKLTEKDSVLLADFVNTTGDSVFDGTLKQALAVQLEQSPYLNIVPESKIREALRFMGRSSDERLTNDVAREICERQGIRAMLTGTIASLGNHYVVTLTALNGSTGDSLAREQVEVESKEQVLKALDKAASNLRQKMGESLASVQQFAQPLDKATTSSLDALKEYSLGNSEHQKMNEDAAVPHLKKAVGLDPNFAMAYATLGVALNNTGQRSPGIEAIRKAYELRDRASEREKFYIQAHYYSEVALDPEKVLDVYAEWRQIYPRDSTPYVNAALQYSALGQPDKALDFASQAHRMNPQDPYANDNMATAYEALNRFDEAKAIAEDSAAHKVGGAASHLVLTDIAYMRADRPTWEHELEASKGTSLESFLLFFNAGWHAAQGKLRESRQFWERAHDEAMTSGAKDFAGTMLIVDAYVDALYGNDAAAHQKCSQALGLSTGSDVKTGAALVYALTDEAQKSAALVAAVRKDDPDNRLIQSYVIPQIQAALEIQKNQLAQAITTLEPLRTHEFGTGPQGTGVAPPYLRGEAYLKQHDGTRAAAEFQRILDHRGAVGFGPEYPLAYLNLGRAYALQGDNTRARTAYQDFFAAWKDADSDIPILKIAKQEYEKLK